jgi:site-specific DNA-cytosine methylase
MCAGYGGIGLGLKNIFGERLRTIAYCELEGFAQANLISKMEAGLLDAAPIWSDLKTFPYESFHGLVDILIAGYPCQPFSAAGKRAGKDDPRHLWPWIADGIRILRPKLCFFENVEGHISLGLREVIGELESIGYKAAWGIFSASEVGAPHQRKRVFILAYDQSQRIQGHWADWLQEPRPHAGQGLPMRGGDAGCGELADACHGSNPAHGYAESHRLPSEHWQEVCSGFAGGANATAWPSRPGQPQYAWEPPRVVANSKRSGGEEPEHLDANLPSEPSGGDSEGVGNSKYSGLTTEQIIRSDEETSNEWRKEEQEQARQLEGTDRSFNVPSIRGCQEGIELGNSNCGRFSSGINTGSCSETDSGGQDNIEQADVIAMGNAECIRIPTSREHGAMDEASGIPTDRERGESTQANSESSPAREREDSGINASECSKIEPEMGRNIDGTTYGVDISELSGLSHSELAEIREWMVRCDNRTDELRLLGNGVVPATAERAFRTLWEELK